MLLYGQLQEELTLGGHSTDPMRSQPQILVITKVTGLSSSDNFGVSRIFTAKDTHLSIWAATVKCLAIFRNLMAPQDLKDLGFTERGTAQTPAKPETREGDNVDWEARKQKGFVAGIRR